MTPKHFFRVVSGIVAILLAITAVVWTLLFLKFIPAEPGNSLFFLSAMEDLVQTQFFAGTGMSFDASVVLIGISLALSAVLSWVSHALRDRVIRYKLDQGEVRVPIHMVERLVLDIVNYHPGLSLTDVRFYRHRGKPNLGLRLNAAYKGPYMDTVLSLKKRLIREIESYTGVTLGRVDAQIKLVDAPLGLSVAGIASTERASESEGFECDSADDENLDEMTNQVYEESLADLEEVVSTLDDEPDPMDLSLGLSSESGVQIPDDVHHQEASPGSVHNPYYSAIDLMEKAGVNREYINGWACGYLHNPVREEQRLNDAYEAGYEDGMGGDTSSYRSWVSSAESPTSQDIS